MTGNRLNFLLLKMQEKGIIETKKEFCDLLGFDYGSLGKYLSGKVNVVINENNFKKYKKAGINIDWLLTGEGEMFRGETKEVSQTYAKIPLLRQRVSCGPGKNWEESDAVETYIEPLCLIPSFRNKNIYAFRAEGLSMVGAGIHDGDIVLFDAGSNAPEDDIYVFAWEGNVFCKLLKFNEFDHIINVYSVHSKEIDKAELLKKLDMDNPEVIDNFRLFGRVLGWIHENRLVRH